MKLFFYESKREIHFNINKNSVTVLPIENQVTVCKIQWNSLCQIEKQSKVIIKYHTFDKAIPFYKVKLQGFISINSQYW